MSVNQESVTAKWPEIKAEVAKTWNKVTMPELDQTKGERGSIAALVQKHYSTESDFQKKYDEILGKFTTAKDASHQSASESKKN